MKETFVKMGLDIVKSNGTRCPGVLIAGLVIMWLYLLCTWWSLSSQNSELVNQLDNLSQQLKINADELSKCSQDRSLLDEKLKDSQNRFVQQQIKIEQVKESEDEVKESYQKVETELQESKKKSETAEKSLGLCKAEMESLKKLGESKDKATETLRTENESLKSEIDQKETRIKELEGHLKTLGKTVGSSSNKIGQPKSNLVYAMAKNYVNLYKNSQKAANTKTEKDTKGTGEQQLEEKFDEGKNYGDAILSMDNDPREEEMKDS